MIYIQSAFSQEEQRLELVGRQGEGGTRQLVFDCADVLAEYPDALIVCAMQRAGDRTAYLKDCATDGTNRAVTLESADVAVPGTLKIELRALIGDDVRKSAVYIAKVAESLRGAQDRPGNPIADVLNRIDMTISRAEESIAEADAAAKSAQTVADIVQAKLDNGDFVGPAGKDGSNGKDGAPGKDGKDGKPGSDASVTAENIQAALGYTPVKDVQVAGVSVLTDDVANVPMANKGVLGVSSVDNYSIGTTNTGSLFLYNSRKEDIDARSANIALTPYNLDYAVKAAMCDGKGAAWTAAQQAAARERMGVVRFTEMKHITTLVIAEETSSIIVDLGKQCSICRFYYQFPETISEGYTYVEVSNNNTEYYNMSGCNLSSAKYMDYIRIASALKTISLFAPVSFIGNESVALLRYSMPISYAMDETDGFRYLKFTTYTMNFPKNTTIEVYAV